MLKNISRKAPELSLNNPDVTLNPYLSQATKQIYVPEVTIRPAANDGAEKSQSEIDSSFASPTLSKKSKKLPKKYLQLNRTATTPRFSSVEGSKSDERSVRIKESSAPAFRTFNGKTKPKNGSLPVPPTNVQFDIGSTEKPKSRRGWNVQDSSIQAKPRFTLRLNNSNSNNIVNVNNLKSLNVSKDVQLPSRYNIAPRPFSALPSSNPLVVTTNAPHRKPSLPPTGFRHQQQITRSSANVLPLVLPTDLFNPSSTRRYVPIKRTNLEGNSATIVSTEASPVRERTTLADYNAVYSAIIGATKNPLVTVNSQQSYSPSVYYGTTKSPTERTVTKTNFATYIPSQTSASYNVQQRKDSQVTHGNDFLPRTASYNSPEKSSLNENPGIALYNKFASLYSTNVPNVFNTPKAITQDFKQPAQPSQQQVFTLPRATLTPLTPTLLKVRPIISSKPVPYYDSRLLVSQDGKYNTNNAESDEASEPEDADRTEKEDDENDETGKYKAEINRKVYKVYKTPKTQHEKENREEEEEEPQQSRNYGYQDKDKPRKYDENIEGNKNDNRREKYKNVRHENNDDEEVGETEEEEYVSTGKSEDEDSDAPRQHNKYEYDRNFDEKRGEKPRYDYKKNKKPKDRRDKYESDIELRFENNNEYLESLYNDDDDEVREGSKEYRDRFDKKKLAGDNRYKKNRKYGESEDESVAENKPFVQQSKNRHAYKQDKIYEVEQSDNGDERKYHYQVSPRKVLFDSPREKHTREEYHPQRVESDHRDHPGHESGNQDDAKAEEHDHVHGETQEHAETHKHEEHHGKKKGGGNHKFEEGGGEEHGQEHHGHEGEKGEKVNCYLHYIVAAYC